MVRTYKDKELLDRVKSLDSFTEFPEGYWILAVRSIKDIPNKFDDKFYIYKGEEFVRVLTGTTNPGLSVLKGGWKKYNKKGAAVVKSNEWYYDVYKYGLHRGKMPALRQRKEKDILYYRDGNNDSKSNESGKVYSGVIYTNFHGANYNQNSAKIKSVINGWSAGCFVANNTQEYYSTIDMFRESEQKYFTICLIKEFKK